MQASCVGSIPSARFCIAHCASFRLSTPHIAVLVLCSWVVISTLFRASSALSLPNYCESTTQASSKYNLQQNMPVMKPRKAFLLFGDSLTQQSFDSGGWGGRLASLYQRKADITLRGYSGYNTRWIKHVVEDILPVQQNSARYHLATLWFGANDAALPNRCNARQHVPISEYKSNLNAFIDRLQALTAQVILITPPPVDEEKRIEVNEEWDSASGKEGPERTLQMSGKYAEAVKEVGRDRGLPVLDLWTQLQAVPEWQSLLTDGLHFAPKGNEIVFKLLMQLVDKELPHFREEALLTDLPTNTEIDADAIAASFHAHAEK